MSNLEDVCPPMWMIEFHDLFCHSPILVIYVRPLTPLMYSLFSILPLILFIFILFFSPLLAPDLSVCPSYSRPLPNERGTCMPAEGRGQRSWRTRALSHRPKKIPDPQTRTLHLQTHTDACRPAHIHADKSKRPHQPCHCHTHTHTLTQKSHLYYAEYQLADGRADYAATLCLPTTPEWISAFKTPNPKCLFSISMENYIFLNSRTCIHTAFHNSPSHYCVIVLVFCGTLTHFFDK